MTLPAIIFLDRIGRRPTLLFGTFMMMTLLFISGSIQAVYGQPDHTPGSPTTWHLVDKPNAGRGVVAVSYLFVAAFATTMGPVSWTYPAEIFPSKVTSPWCLSSLPSPLISIIPCSFSKFRFIQPI